MPEDLNSDLVADLFYGRTTAELVFDIHEAATNTLDEFAALRALLDERGAERPLPAITINSILVAGGKLKDRYEPLGVMLEGVAGWWVADRPPIFAPHCVSVAEAILLAAVHLSACLRDAQPEWFGAITDVLDKEDSRLRFERLFGPNPDEEDRPKSFDDLDGYLARQYQRDMIRLDALNLPFRNEFSLVCDYAAERAERYKIDEVTAALTCEAAMLCRHSSDDGKAKARSRGMKRLSGKIVSSSFNGTQAWAFRKVTYHSGDFPQWLRAREACDPKAPVLNTIAPLSSTDELILEAIHTRPLTPKQIHHAIGGDRTNMFRRLDILRSRNQIKKDARTGEYYRTDREIEPQ